MKSNASFVERPLELVATSKLNDFRGSVFIHFNAGILGKASIDLSEHYPACLHILKSGFVKLWFAN